MEPLSAASAIVGLLAAAGQVASILSKLKSSVSDAPDSIELTLLQVKELQACFAAVHKFIVGATPASQRRLSMIEVDQLVATLTESILTFNELEILVTPFRTCPRTSIQNRIKWVWKEDVVSSIMLRLDRHKSSLSLMLNIVQCESDREAEQSQKSLLNLVQQLVESNVEISRRLKTLETTSETESILTACFRNGNSVDRRESVEATTDQPVEISQRTTSTILDTSSVGLPSLIFHSAFENDLIDSRVYKRTQPYECDVSFTSSAVRSHSWSVFSGLSLSQISSISVIALPVYSHEIANKEWYDFVFFDQPPTLAAIDEETQEVEEVDIDYYADRYDHNSDCKLGEAIAPSTDAAIHIGLIRGDCWIPQAQPNGTVIFYNTITGQRSLDPHLESASSRIQNEAGDPLNAEILAESRPPPEMIARNGVEDDESDGGSGSEGDGEGLMLAATNAQPSNTGASTNPVFQPINTNIIKIQPRVPLRLVPFPFISKPARDVFPSEPARHMFPYKLIVLGASGVGKTALVTQLTIKSFVETYHPTMEDAYRKQMLIDGQSCILEILDTLDPEEYTALYDQWIRDREGFVLVYSITSRRTFGRISRFHNQIQRVKESSYSGSPVTSQHYTPAKMPPIMLVGTKSDRVVDREVSTKEGYNLAAKLGCGFVETSAKNSIAVQKAFYDVVRQLRRERMMAVFREATQGYTPKQYRQP